LSLIRRIVHRSVPQLTRAAAVLALLGLGLMAYSVVSPRPLPVILAMSVGHVIGALAVGCYILAIALHASRAPEPPDSAAPATDPATTPNEQRDAAE
jgi:hypothetical protein